MDKKKTRASEIANTFEWLITAFILAFIFRSFVMEAYRIPTGSMADTLRGAHFSMRCKQCGQKYDYGFVPENYNLPRDSMPKGTLKLTQTKCPSCGHSQSAGGNMPISYGDRILVLKDLYQFKEPKRWDVVVFKNPLNPTENYIKRLIGKPGEKVEIIDGDIYINDNIARKPKKVQKEHWMCVYDNNHQPVKPFDGTFNGRSWQQPFDVTNSAWKIPSESATTFQLLTTAGHIFDLAYNIHKGNDFKTAYSYNEPKYYRYMPVCSDTKIRFIAKVKGDRGIIGASTSKYQITYKALIDLSGEMAIYKIQNGGESKLTSRTIDSKINFSKPHKVTFQCVDHLLSFKFGKESLDYDLGTTAASAGAIIPNAQPDVRILGSGDITVTSVAIFRDTHYTGGNSPRANHSQGLEGHPIFLQEDQFFTLGDNSPNSADGRWWNRPGIGNNNKQYKQGIVPREYLVGKAVFVYWPMGLKLFKKDPIGLIPNASQLRWIYGGK